MSDPGSRRPATEEQLLARITGALQRATGQPPDGEIWIGDDAAVVHIPGTSVVLATDATVGGVHADLSLVSLDDLGWKALTAAVSDIGAMGAWPRHALVALCAPPGTDVELVNRGLAEAAARWGCPIVGGDLSAASTVVVAVTVTGSVGEGPGPVTRSGASPGDRLFLTGPLGASAAGLRLLRGPAAGSPAEGAARGSPGVGAGAGTPAARHRRPLARLLEGWTARLAGATAMIDVTDGLSLDLDRLARASGVGARLDGVPVAPGATQAEALGGGEDYELLIATPDGDRLRGAFARAGLRPPLPVGVCTDDPAERTLAGAPLGVSGWQHSF
ncbi:MAG TPA: thiamine-phosphate kinase [Acidimicrobiales bacterium]|nr:thiamine-phosphate kinase [Acidimicrobiales bacterium]